MRTPVRGCADGTRDFEQPWPLRHRAVGALRVQLCDRAVGGWTGLAARAALLRRGRLLQLPSSKPGRSTVSWSLPTEKQWSVSPDPNLRRAASDGLRGIVRVRPDLVWPVLENLASDRNLYIKKSVANVLPNASAKPRGAVLRSCRKWASRRDSNTAWIIEDGLRKLNARRPEDVDEIIPTSAASS